MILKYLYTSLYAEKRFQQGSPCPSMAGIASKQETIVLFSNNKKCVDDFELRETANSRNKFIFQTIPHC